MIQSQVNKGKIYSGVTSLASDISVVETGLMQLTVKAGSFTTTGDKRLGIAPQTFVLLSDSVFNLTSDVAMTKFYKAELGVDAAGVVDVLMRSRIDDYPDAPVGWQKIHDIVFEFALPPNTLSLDMVDILVLTVEQGFPAGTTAADWQMQIGQV